MYHKLQIEEGALFIADAHDSDERDSFFQFLLEIEQDLPPQLFLMGDMFDLLVGSVRYGVKKYKHYIEKIEQIAQKCDVYYLEGNHDFNLSRLFIHTKVIPIKMQPLLCKLPDGKTCLLLHGDKYGKMPYSLYVGIIRNPFVLFFLNLADIVFDGVISKKIMQKQTSKNLCKTIEGFQNIVEQKLENYPKADVIAEGHYHQDCDFWLKGCHYINFSSFACNQSYFSVQSSLNSEFLRKQLRGFNG